MFIYEAETVIVMIVSHIVAFTLVNGLSGKCVASGRVVVVVSLSSCSFLLMVDKVIIISMESSLVYTV